MTIEKTSLDAAIMTALAQLKSSPDIEHGKIVIAYLQSCVDFLNEKYIGVNIHLRMQDQYYNMKEKIEPFFHILPWLNELCRGTELIHLYNLFGAGLMVRVFPLWDHQDYSTGWISGASSINDERHFSG